MMVVYSGGSETARYYYHFDGLGSVVALSDSSGNIVEKYRYSVFGETTILSPSDETRAASSFGNSRMFTGREYDSETSLYYFRARFYKPNIGRFLQTDPVGYNSSINLYIYCGNNGINYLDPYGLDWLNTAANFCAGAGDSLTFGLTGLVRKVIMVDDEVNRGTTSYKAGEYTEIAVEIGATLGSATLKTAAKKAGQKAIRDAAKKATRNIARKGKVLTHKNPLLGHPGGKEALFPTGGLPPSTHSGNWNLKLMEQAKHLAEHRKMRQIEEIIMKLFNPFMTAARAARDMASDSLNASDKTSENSAIK